MTIRHLKIFIEVAQTGKMRKAAENLYISQPAVSQAIRELEEHYHVKLFERLSQKIYITDQGKMLLQYAKYLINSFDEMEYKMNQAGEHPMLKIGASVSVGSVLLEDYLAEFEGKMPKADVRVVVNNTSEIEKKVCEGEVDLGLVEGAVDSADLIIEPICQDELLPVVGKCHPFYDAKGLTLQDLEGQSFISREAGSAERNQYENLLDEKGITVQKTWKSTNILSIKNAVMAGRGIAILSSLVVKDELARGDMKALSLKNAQVKRQIKLIYHKNKFVSDAMEQMIAVCRYLKSDNA